MPLTPNPLPRFLLGLLIFMPLCMAVWWFGLRDILLLLLLQVTELITTEVLADKIIAISPSQNNVWILQTSLSPISDPSNLLGIPISTSRFTISFPLLWGLLLATPNTDKFKQIIWGTVVLIPIAVLIALLTIQFKLALQINYQQILTEVPRGEYLLVRPYSETVYYLMAVGRQLATLVLPTLGPALVWGLFNWAFIRNLIIKGLLGRAGQVVDGTEQQAQQ